MLFTAARNYLDKQMAPADLVAIVSLADALTVNQDFTQGQSTAQESLRRSLAPARGRGLRKVPRARPKVRRTLGGSFTPDDTEYNIFNTDRRLEAMRTIAAQLSHVEQKKSLIYFSSGMDRTGIENESELRAAINAAVRANLSIYTLDIRGLQALVPGGEAQNASLRGTSPYSGAFHAQRFEFQFHHAGNLGHACWRYRRPCLSRFQRFQQGVQRRSGRYVELLHARLSQHQSSARRTLPQNHRAAQAPGYKIEYRKGYYGPADFKHSNQEDRERQLDEELASELPSTDLPVYLAAGYFRIGDDKFFVPISIVVPGSEIPFASNSTRDKATLDIVGEAVDDKKRPVGDMRDTVKLAVETSAQVKRKNVQYDSGFILPAGAYHMKFVVRENQTGRMGSFETDATIPDLKSAPLKMSSVILASQIQSSSKKGIAGDPLVRNGSEIVPNVTHVFTSQQHLYFYYEVYDPAREGANGKAKANGDIHILSNVAFFQGKAKTYETPLVETKQLNAPDRHAAVFQLDAHSPSSNPVSTPAR